jgi:hypothetical protein
MKHFMRDSLAAKYNWEGKMKMGALRDVKLFSSIIPKMLVSATYSHEMYVAELKTSLDKAHKRQHQANFKAKMSAVANPKESFESQ